MEFVKLSEDCCYKALTDIRIELSLCMSGCLEIETGDVRTNCMQVPAVHEPSSVLPAASSKCQLSMNPQLVLQAASWWTAGN